MDDEQQGDVAALQPTDEAAEQHAQDDDQVKAEDAEGNERAQLTTEDSLARNAVSETDAQEAGAGQHEEQETQGDAEVAHHDDTDATEQEQEQEQPVAAADEVAQQLEERLQTSFAEERTNSEATGHAHEPRVEIASPVAASGEAEKHVPVRTPSAKEKSPSPGGDLCCVCGKKVYPLEKLVAEKNLFHKTCFRCKKCNRTLTTSNYATLSNEYYCKPHQLELFRLQGRYDASESRAEIVNRSPVDSPTAESAPVSSEASAEELRRARAMFEKAPESPQSPTAAPSDIPAPQYGGVGALKSRYLASATQNAGESNRPPPRKMTPPRHDPAAGLKANGDTQATAGHGEFENEPLRRTEDVVRESDRTQFEAELPKQGAAKSALAVFRNLETSSNTASPDPKPRALEANAGADASE